MVESHGRRAVGAEVVAEHRRAFCQGAKGPRWASRADRARAGAPNVADGDARDGGRRARGGGPPSRVVPAPGDGGAAPPSVCPPVTEMCPALARIAVAAPRLSAYDAVVEGTS